MYAQYTGRAAELSQVPQPELCVCGVESGLLLLKIFPLLALFPPFLPLPLGCFCWPLGAPPVFPEALETFPMLYDLGFPSFLATVMATRLPSPQSLVFGTSA